MNATTEPMTLDRTHVIADVSEIVAAAGHRSWSNDFAGRDFVMNWGTSAIRDGVRVAIEHDDIVIHLFTKHLIDSTTRVHGKASAEMVATIVLAYLEQVA